MNESYLGLDCANDVGEYVADDGAQQKQNSDNDDGDQNQDQRVFDQTLTFFARQEQHVFHPPLCRRFDKSYFFVTARIHYIKKRPRWQGVVRKYHVNIARWQIKSPDRGF